ncbi:MAG: hypothetical protein AB9M53_02560 [Leptothrix sp. (in: b-proteobacteria)]
MKKTTSTLLLSVALVGVHAGTYKDPVGGAEYRAEWRTYQPKDGVKERAGFVQVASIRLLSTQEEFEKNVSVQSLSEFMEATQANIALSVGAPLTEFQLLVNTTLSKDADPTFEFASQGEVTKAQLQKIHEGLLRMKGFNTKSTTLKYQVHYIIKRG